VFLVETDSKVEAHLSPAWRCWWQLVGPGAGER